HRLTKNSSVSSAPSVVPSVSTTSVVPPSSIMTDTKTYIFAGGGTGGHLYPGISVAQALVKRMPEARPLFLCTKREIDRIILKPTGFEFIEQPIIPPVRTIGGLLRFWEGWRHTKDLVKQVLRDRHPTAVLGLGGYAAGV